jgi:phosphate transport system substrate-binding protein
MVNSILSVIIAFMAITPGAASAGGKLSYSGSSTIGMGIFEAGASKQFEGKTGISLASMEMPGSGKGIQALLAGKVSVAGVSRKLKAVEKDRGLVGTVIGHDAIAVFVHNNNPVNSLTKEQIKGIFTGRTRNWKEVGGKDAPIEPNTEIAGANRATMLTFQELAMDNAPYGDGFKQIDFPRDQIIETAKNENAVCTVSMGLLSRLSSYLRGKVKIVAVNGVRPTEADIASESYMLSRPLLLVTRGKPRGDAKRLTDYMLSADGQRVVRINFIRTSK